MKALSVATGLALVGSLYGLEISDFQLRKDIYPLETKTFQWVEGWGEKNQFFPRYFKLSAYVQVAVKNTRNTPIKLDKFSYMGQKVEKAVTHPDFAGPLIWYGAVPRVVAPGATALVNFRLRKMPRETVKIGIMGKKLEVAVDRDEKFRIIYAAFNAKRDQLYVYSEKLNGAKLIPKDFFIDGKALKAEVFDAGKLVYTRIVLPKALPYGKFVILKAKAGDFSTFVQLRVRDDSVYTGIIGSNIKAYRQAGFNLIYSLHGNRAAKSEKGFARLCPTSQPEAIREVAIRPGNSYVYGNHDEPDAHEPPGLPYMERCGINVMKKVLPLVHAQRAGDPHHLNALMIDRTYAPLNWYIYAQTIDLPFNDCYVPTKFHGYDSEVIATTAKVFLQAVSPKPPHLMLWVGANTNHSPRVTSWMENEAQVFYALGSGIKGLHYFIDWTSYPRISEGGFFQGVTQFPSLFRAVARGNALVNRLQAVINNSYPWHNASSASDKDIWSSVLLSGSDTLMVTAVNRNIQTHALDKMKTVHHFPINGGHVIFKLPPWYADKKLNVRQVAWNKVSTPRFIHDRNSLKIELDGLSTGKIFVVSLNPKIDDKLRGDSAVLKKIKELQKIPVIKAGKQIAACVSNGKVIDLRGKLDLNLIDPATLKLASEIRLVNSTLEIHGNKLALRPGKKELEARAELLFRIRTPHGFLSANLKGETFSLGYMASLSLELGEKKQRFTTKSSIDKFWHRKGILKNEYQLRNKENNEIWLRVVLKDPMIVAPDNYSCGVQTLSLSLNKLGESKK